MHHGAVTVDAKSFRTRRLLNKIQPFLRVRNAERCRQGIRRYRIGCGCSRTCGMQVRVASGSRLSVGRPGVRPVRNFRLLRSRCCRDEEQCEFQGICIIMRPCRIGDSHSFAVSPNDDVATDIQKQTLDARHGLTRGGRRGFR